MSNIDNKTNQDDSDLATLVDGFLSQKWLILIITSIFTSIVVAYLMILEQYIMRKLRLYLLLIL